MSDTDLAVFRDEYLPHLEKSDLYKKWVKFNPGEAARWATYRDAILAGQQPAEPPMASEFGQSLVDAGQLAKQAPAPPPPPPPPPSGLIPFGSYDSMAAQHLSGENVVVTKRTITGIFNGRSLVIENAHNVELDVDCGDPKGGVYLLNCTGTFKGHVRTDRCGWNVVQFDKCSMVGSLKIEGFGGSGTEDMVSVDDSGGLDWSRPLIVEDGHFENRNFQSPSGSGLMADNKPRFVIFRNNVLINPGQVGIGVHSPTVKVQNNKIYSDGQGHPIVRVGIDCADAKAAGCEVSGNQVDWRNSGGGYEPYSVGPNAPTITGWATNDFQKRFTAAELAAMHPVIR